MYLEETHAGTGSCIYIAPIYNNSCFEKDTERGIFNDQIFYEQVLGNVEKEELLFNRKTPPAAPGYKEDRHLLQTIGTEGEVKKRVQ